MVFGTDNRTSDAPEPRCRSCSQNLHCQAARNESKHPGSESRSWARAGFKRLQRILAISFLLSSFAGGYLLATDGSLWHLALSHAFGLVAIVIIDAALCLFNLSSSRNAYLPSLAAGALGFVLQLGDITTAPQYHMTIAYFASYLFGIWAYDVLLGLQLTVIVAGVIGRRYASYLSRVKRARGGTELNYTRRRFIGSLFGIGAIIAGAVFAASVRLPASPQSTANTSQSSDPSGSVANASQMQVGSPVYFDYPKGYPNILLKKSDGTLAAFSLLCTHACCPCNYDASSNLILCPCHGSIFDATGRVVRGPAGMPLPSIELSIDSAGYVYPKGINGFGPCVP